MIDRNIEEALNLIGMQVHCNEAVDTGHAQKVGDQFGGDRYAGFVFTVLSCPSEIGGYGDNRIGRSAFGSVDHKEKLHQIVGVGISRLDQKYLATANRFFKRH